MNDVIKHFNGLPVTLCQLSTARCRFVAGPKEKSTKTTSRRVSLRATVSTGRLNLSSAELAILWLFVKKAKSEFCI